MLRGIRWPFSPRSDSVTLHVVRMESENTEEKSEQNGASEQSAETEQPNLKLRDLRPEKDPLGAGRAR